GRRIPREPLDDAEPTDVRRRDVAQPAPSHGPRIPWPVREERLERRLLRSSTAAPSRPRVRAREDALRSAFDGDLVPNGHPFVLTHHRAVPSPFGGTVRPVPPEDRALD